ncbi:DNA adenine methylase [Myxococcota bacterium]|nr:DNA adenine methylase [Myxococcota bacterium]
MIKYLGSKRRLLPLLVEVITRLEPDGPVLDPFSGTCRLGHALKARGRRVLASDHNAYAAALATCYVQADAEDHAAAAARLVAELNALPGRPGWFTETYSLRSRYLHPRNGERVDAIRQAIADKGLEPELEAVLLVSLMEAADRVDSTTGVQMAWLKQWAPRATRDLELRVPALLPRARGGKGRAACVDALPAAQAADEATVCYLDPPYNRHSYRSNYHLWETLVRWDQPHVYGVACKRLDCRELRSPYNSRRGCLPALQQLLDEVRAPHLVLSFNDEGFLDGPTLEQALAVRPHRLVLAREGHRYVGARIGIHNHLGQKVGSVGRLRNVEHVYVATTDPRALARVAPLLAESARSAG